MDYTCALRRLDQRVEHIYHREASPSQVIKLKEELKTMKSHVLRLNAVTPFYYL